MALNSLFCAEVPLSNYSLTLTRLTMKSSVDNIRNLFLDSSQ